MILSEDPSLDALEAEYGPIGARLRSPRETLSLADFADAIEALQVSLRVAELAPLVGDPGLPGRLRGALGDIWAEGASEAALAGRPCSFDPPSAFEVLFRKQGRMTAGTDFPSPWLIAVDPVRRDLIVRLTVFGLAGYWAPVAAEAVVETARRVDWAGAADRFLPRWSVMERSLHRLELPPLTAGDDDFVSGYVVETLSPVVLTGGGATARPASLFSTLSQRIEGMARWHEVTVDADWRQTAGLLGELDWEWSEVQEVRWTRGSRRQDRSLAMQGTTGRLTVTGDRQVLAGLEPLFRLAGVLHLGADVAFGCGRVVVRAF